MSSADIVGLALSYVYVFSVIALSEVLQRGRHVPVSSTRKFVHIAVGMWAFGTVLLFQTWYVAIIPPVSFVLINYISYRQDIFKAMESADKRNLGTVYFPISFALIIALYWAKPAAIVAGLMTMTWGDALASLVGQKWGKHRYSLFGYTKSWEGVAGMLAFSTLAVLPALVFFGVNWPWALVYALAVSAFAALVEALSMWGVDNLTVPLLSTTLLWFLLP